MHFTTVQMPETEDDSTVTVSQEKMQQLIGSLHPISRVSPSPLIGDCYTLAYQAGMDPTWVRVGVGDNALVFEWDDIVYIGGNPAAFLDAVEAIDPVQETDE